MQEQETTRAILRGGSRHFTETHWSLVLAAKAEGSSRAAEAMEKLCGIYWRPVYAYIRRQNHNSHEAEDLTQGFFAQLLAKDYLQHLRHRDGKFRSFLLTFVKRFLSDERDKAGAQKRGGGKFFISLDDISAEDSYLAELRTDSSPDQIFDRRWAQMVMARALSRLREEYVAAGKAKLFDELKDIQPGEHGESSYAEIGARLGLAKGTIASAVHRLRKRHREIVREEIAHTVARSEELDEEIRNLLAALGQ